ncbi:MAG: TonB-dependent receptor [Gammaproteobacteria bacterium]|nr:TonB-dependent receptor [Gammaproteobacteria bacterium]
MKTRGRLVCVAAAIVAGSSPALAVEQIIVTAQRREEKLQEVPLAVSAFNADVIATRQIDVVKDIGQNVPNLQTYTVTAGAQAIQVHSRGASVQNPGFNLSESPVGIYQDDIYFGRLSSANLELADIERIEVLRGPQGTLYGRNTIAGAIKVVSRTPGDDAWLNASAGLGNYDTTKFTASAGGPIEEGALAGSVAAVYEKRNRGWQDNPATDSQPGEHENLVVRSKLHWYGSENFDAVLTVWGADLENDGYNGVPQSPFANPDGPGISENFLPAPADSAPLGDFYDNFSPSGANYGESDQAGVSLALDFDLGSVNLRSITGYTNIEDRFGFDLAGGGLNDVPGLAGLLISSDSELDQWSQELQLLGTALDERLNYLVGAFYLNEDGSQLYAGEFFGPGFAESIDNETDSYAVFADGTYNLTERLSVTAGARWTRDEKEYTNDCSGPFCFDDSDLSAPTPGTGFVSLDDDWDETTFRLGTDYQLSDTQLVYASFSQGFQSGGFRTLCFGNLSSTCGGTAFDPQTVDNYELGYKADLFDDTLRFNVSTFYAMYDDIQQVVLNAAGGFPIDNIGEVDVYGVELEVLWSPIDSLNVFANAGWQESDFGDVDPASPPGGLNGNATPTDELPSNPAFQGKIGFDYAITMSEMVEFFYGADLYYSDDYFSEARNQVKIDSYTRVNGFLGIGDPDRSWQVVFTGRNITDEEDYVSGIFSQGFANIRTVLPPAEYMLTFKVNY